MLHLPSAIVSHEQTQSNLVCRCQTLDAVFPKDPFSDYFEQMETCALIIVPNTISSSINGTGK